MIVLHQLVKRKTTNIKCILICYSYIKTRVIKMESTEWTWGGGAAACPSATGWLVRMLDDKVFMLNDRWIRRHACGIQKRAANPRCPPLSNMIVCLLAHLLDPAGLLDAGLRLHVTSIRSPRQVTMLSQGHAEPEQVWTDWKVNTLNAPHRSTSAYTSDAHKGSEISFLLLL